MFAVAPIVAIGTAAVGFVLANHYLVAPFAEVDLRYFTKAKLVNVAIGAAAFGVVASPLLLYNWQVFGSPCFNHNTAHEMWLDATGQLPLFDQGLPTMLSYLAAHSAGQILGRFLSGLVRVRGIEWVWPFLLVFLCLPRRWLTYFRQDTLRFSFLTLFLDGSTTLPHDVLFNGSTLLGGTRLDTSPEFYRVTLAYERTLLPLPAGGTLSGSVGLTLRF